MESVEKKLLSCLFLLDVLCSHVKREGLTGVMERCFKCSHYLRFMREMEEEEAEFFEEAERLRRGKSLG